MSLNCQRVGLLGLPEQTDAAWVTYTKDIFFFIVLEARSLKSRCLWSLVASEASLLGLQTAALSLAPDMAFPLCWAPGVSPSYKDPGHVGSEAILTTSF